MALISRIIEWFSRCVATRSCGSIVNFEVTLQNAHAYTRMIGSRAVGPISIGSRASGAAQCQPVNPPRAAPGRPRLCLPKRAPPCAADDPLRPRRRAISLCALSRGGDLNALESQLRRALAKEDYAAAAALRDSIAAASGVTSPQGSWEALGVPTWLADRASQLGFAIPTAIQRAAVPAVLSGRDVLLTSRPGSGKSLAFLLPALARLFFLEESDLDDSDLEPRALVGVARMGCLVVLQMSWVSYPNLASWRLCTDAPTPLLPRARCSSS